MDDQNMDSATMMTGNSDSRIFLLEEQVKTLSDELMQCQADKEFVWSLWKRLQVANPDLTQAVSLVVEREKHKAEMKDRKVLEILQSKDLKIQELEQKTTVQQQEMSSLVQKALVVEESALMKREAAALQEQLLTRTQELTKMKEECRRQKEAEQRVVKDLEEKTEGLESCCAALRAALEERDREHRDSAQDTVKELEAELHKAWQELSSVQSHSSSLAAQLSAKDQLLMTKEGQLTQLRQECAEVQALYRQSTEHAVDQSLLIRQLEGLNLDTQRVMRNQEEAHNADATSYQKLYKELSQCYQALVSSEAKLRQSHQHLTDQMVQKEQQIQQLQSQLEHLRESPPVLQPQPQQTTLSPNRQTNFKAAVCEPLKRSHSSEQVSTHELDLKDEEKTLRQHSSRSVTRHKRSRSLSPAGSVVERGGVRRKEAEERRIQDLQEMLQLKIEENEELRKAHDNRRERLRLIQTNYRTVKEQLKELEKASGIGGRTQRAEPWQLRQEDCDGVWNELAYLKNLTRKLNMEKAGLEEELDMVRVQAAMDRATVKEVHLRLSSEHKELLHKVVMERQVKSSTPKKPSVSAQRLEESFKKIEQLEVKMVSLEEETDRLREEKEHLQEANEDLAHNCYRLQASVEHLRAQDAARCDAAQAEVLAMGERHCSEMVTLEGRLTASRKEATLLHHKLLRLRQEVGILRAARDYYRHRAAGPTRASEIANNISTKVKFKTSRGSLHRRGHRRVSPNQAISWQHRSPSPSKDEWEDMSADSDMEEYSDSLNSVTSRTVPKRECSWRKFYRSEKHLAKSTRKLIDQDDEQQETREHRSRGEKRRRKMRRKSSLVHRVQSLQRHVNTLTRAKKDALDSNRDLHKSIEKITAQLHSLTHRLSSSKQLTQKLTCDLAAVEQQKKVLELELQQWRQITLAQHTTPVPAAPIPTAPVNSECSCQGKPTPPDPALQTLEAEVKQLHTKLKSAGAEVTRQVAANKALRGQLQEKEDKLRQLQDKLTHVERDVTMKRQLVEDLKTRLKFLQDMENSYRGQVEDLDKKVKTLTEEATNRKAFIESLKRRLNVAMTEKSQYETSCTKLKEDLDKKEQRIHALQGRVGASEQALSALEKTATEQMEALTHKSSQALDRVQRQLTQAYSQLEQLHAFIKALASEILLDVHEVKQQLMKKRRQRRASSVAAKGGLSAKSMIKAKSIAASILNMSENDLADIMDTDQETGVYSEGPGDQKWIDHVHQILQQKIPSAVQLMEAVRVKMKERKVLTEELATISPTAVSEKP